MIYRYHIGIFGQNPAMSHARKFSRSPDPNLQAAHPPGLGKQFKNIGKAIDFGRMNQPFWRSKGSTLQEISLSYLKVCF